MLNTTTFQPYPDYWIGYGFNRFVGPEVLSATTTSKEQPTGLNNTLRVYAHCAAPVPEDGASPSGDVIVFWSSASVVDTYNLTIAIGAGAGGSVTSGDLYRLSPGGGDLYSPDMELNGQVLKLGANDELPAFDPVHEEPQGDGSVQVTVPPMGTGWVVLKGANAAACSTGKGA